MSAPRKGARGPVLVTGASGFIGGALCERLVDSGYEVRGLHRRARVPPRLAALEQRGLLALRCDLVGGEGLEPALRGVKSVIHLAALAYDWGPKEDFERSNVDATRALLKASRESGIGRFVYLSSAAVHGFGRHVDTVEDGPFYPHDSAYQSTKLEAERLVLKEDGPGFRTLAIRACNVYGPGDETSTYEMFRNIEEGVFGYVGKGEALTCPVYIDDLCEAIVLALEREELGGLPILVSDGQKVTWKEYAGRMYELAGGKKKPVSLPAPLALATAKSLEAGWRVAGKKTGKAPPLTVYRIKQASSDYHFSNARARALLGFEPKVFYREGLARAYEAYRAWRATGEAPSS
jgi:nucleoside-diphosphate-sugar epimerase